MTDKRDRERDGQFPATRDADTPARSQAAAPAHHPTQPEFSRGTPAPEFLSLTYTLPYHLVTRADEIARDSYRSQSEVLADALRLYVRIWKARRTHARVSTVEGFSYQEVEFAEALLEEDIDVETIAGNRNGNGAANGHGPANGHGQPNGSGHDDVAAAATDVAEPAPETEAAEVESEARQEPALEAPAEAPPATAAGTGASRPAPPPEPAAADAVDARQETAEAEVVDGGDAKAEAEVEVREAPAAAAVAVDDEEPDTSDAEREDDEDEELHEVADPASSVRRELEAVAGEPMHSLRLQRTLEKIAARIDVKDHSPEDHSATVAEMARKLGRMRGLQGRDLQHIHLAGLAHDIGKANIPDHILAKRRPCPEEMAMIRKYPEFGAELLRIVPSLEPVVPLVASHQERWNGNGYPDGRQGGDIPLASQIVAICDVYQVLINDRHYRPAYTEERALQIIRQNVGTLWNPEIARSFLKMINADDEDE